MTVNASRIILGLVVLQVSCFVVPQIAFSQTEKIDIIQFTSPAGWTKTPKDGLMVYSNSDKNTGGYCLLTVYPSTASADSPNKDFAVEDGARLAIQNSFVKLMARAMRLAVVNQRVRVRVLSGGDDVETINPTLRAFLIECDIDVVTRETRAECDSRRIETAVAAHAGLRRRNVKSLRAFTLHFVMIEPRAIFKRNLNDRIRKINAIFMRACVTLNHRRRAPTLADDEHTRRRDSLRLSCV